MKQLDENMFVRYVIRSRGGRTARHTGHMPPYDFKFFFINYYFAYEMPPTWITIYICMGDPISLCSFINVKEIIDLQLNKILQKIFFKTFSKEK